MSLSRRLFWLGFLALVSVGSPALSLKPYTLTELGQRAERVLRARCLTSYAGRSELGGSISTFSKFEVLELYKGVLRPRRTLLLRVLGGSLGSVSAIMPGAPRFREGRQYLLFLRGTNQDGFPLLVGFTQGVLPLFKDPFGALMIDRREMIHPGLLDPWFGDRSLSLEMFLSTMLDSLRPASIPELGR